MLREFEGAINVFSKSFKSTIRQLEQNIQNKKKIESEGI